MKDSSRLWAIGMSLAAAAIAILLLSHVSRLTASNQTPFLDGDRESQLGASANIAFVCTTNKIGRTDDFKLPSPNWVDVSPPGTAGIRDCAPDPRQPQTRLWAVSADGIWKGDLLHTGSPSWTLVLSTTAIQTATDGHQQNDAVPDRIIPSPTVSGTVLVLHSHGGLGDTDRTWVGRSTDDGLSWSWSQVGNEGEQARPYGFAISRDTTSPDNLTVWATTARGQIYESTDGGRSFSNMPPPRTSLFYQLHAIYAPWSGADLPLYVGGGSASTQEAFVYRREATSGNWTEITPVGTDGFPRGPHAQYELAGPAYDASTIYALVQRSQDNGGNAEQRKLYASADAGEHWELRQDFDGWGFEVTGIGMNVGDENQLYVLRQGSHSGSSSLIFASADGGLTWADRSGNWQATMGNWTGGVAAWDTSVADAFNVLVRDATGTPVGGAQVYHNGRPTGRTMGDGRISIPNLRPGDELVARSLIVEAGTAKGIHSQSAVQDWGYRVYQTSLAIPANGEPAPMQVKDLSVTQVLTVSRSNMLVGFNLVASVEWDASPGFLAELGRKFEEASAYMYDASNGQMLIEQATLYDDRQHWKDADYLVKARDDLRPYVAIQNGGLGQILDNNAAKPNMQREPAYQTLIHEFGHYGLALWDSYMSANPLGYLFGENASCTSPNLSPAAANTNATVMYHEKETTEFSMQGVAGAWSDHCEKTQQYFLQGESDWETILRRYRDTDIPARWQMKTPADYGRVVTGPNAIPIDAWSSVSVGNDVDTGTCSPPIALTNSNSATARVYLVTADRVLYQSGKLKPGRTLEIVGAHDGDTVEQEFLFPYYHVQTDVISGCASIPLAKNTMQTGPSATTPFTLEVSVIPSGIPDQVSVRVRSSAAVSGTPEVRLSQEASAAFVDVPMTYDVDRDLYQGAADLDAALPPLGQVIVSATNTLGGVATSIVDFELLDMASAQDQFINAGGGLIQLALPANALSQDSRVSIGTALSPGPSPGKLAQMGETFFIQGGSEITLSQDAGLTMFYAESDLADAINPSTARLFQWRDGQWNALNSAVNEDSRYVTGLIRTFGIFAVYAERQYQLYVPLILTE